MDQPRSLLYIAPLHSILQLAIGLMVVGMVTTPLNALLQAVRTGETAQAAPALAKMALLAAFMVVVALRTVLRLYRVEGDATGLVARRFGHHVGVPWSDVISVDRPWWGLNPATPVTRVRTRGGVSLCFLAGPVERERLDALRRSFTSHRRAGTGAG